MTTKRQCSSCEGDGCTYLVYGQLDTYEDCERCGGSGERDSRRAVATLEEAYGGTVGPLPDGTTIEVEQVDIREVAVRADFRWQTTPSDSRSFANDLARLRRRHPEAFDATNGSSRESVPLAPAPELPLGAAEEMRARRSARDAGKTASFGSGRRDA